MRSEPGKPVRDRILARIVIAGGGCWNWQGPLDRCGYGFIAIRRRKTSVHRVSYEAFKGPIQIGLTLDHLCLNKKCCNPEHLEPVSRSENSRRAPRVRAFRESVTCKWGHVYDDSNTRVANGKRYCRKCDLRRQREYKARLTNKASLDVPGAQS